jgi:hypothetical protein
VVTDAKPNLLWFMKILLLLQYVLGSFFHLGMKVGHIERDYEPNKKRFFSGRN